MRECKYCKIFKEISNFRVSKRKDKQWHHHVCIECTNKKYMETYYKDHANRKEQLRHKIRKLTYGITEAEFNSLLESQNKSCAICGSSEAGGRGDWHVDHCHKTNKIRGLLCHHCNTGLGLFRDSPELLILAAEYLRESK